MTVIFSIAQAITVRMGHLLGGRDIDSAKQACFAGVFISGMLMLGLAICFWCFPEWLISVDINVKDPNNFTLVADTKALFVSAAISVFLLSWRFKSKIVCYEPH